MTTISQCALALTACLTYPIAQFSLRVSLCKLVWKSRGSPSAERFISGIILAIAILVAMCVEDLDTVLSFVGALFGAPIMFIIPGLFMYFHNKRTRNLRWVTVTSIITMLAGLFFCIVGFVCSILECL
ncbi:putative Amino acid transporter system N2 [Aduncisulcus paluster]|uniref:Amino acid transporter system N2 n=1 Tax=Aduncisulcus paluster TaxID=2918883 RepID=A0ABQ5KYG4_9EUKA|nr:putative Amino acid transporter system N2 [Aduncisulcus paluster]